MTPDDIRQEIELKVVELLKQKVADGSMTEERSQQIAQSVLDILQPGMTYEELFKAIPRLDDTATEIASIIIPYLRDYETNIAQEAQKNVAELIRQGQYDVATKLAKKAITQDVELVWQGSSKQTTKPTQ
jgi:polyhydroxyalkanoate synthesis regulator phasin